MDGAIQQILGYIFNNFSTDSVRSVMMLAMMGYLWMIDKKDREYKTIIREMVNQFQKQSEENRKDLMEIIEKYQEGQISVVQAINEIKILLATIGAKL